MVSQSKKRVHTKHHATQKKRASPSSPRPKALSIKQRPLSFDFQLTTALDILDRFQTQKAPLARMIHTLFQSRHLGQNERRVVRELVFSYVRCAHSAVPRARQILQEQKGRMPSHREENTLVLKWIQEESKELYDFLSLPDWLETLIQQAYPQEYHALSIRLKEKPTATLALDRRFIDTQHACKLLEDHGLEVVVSPLLPCAIQIISPAYISFEKLPPILQQAAWFMNEASQIASLCVRAKPSEHILDLCAGEGGENPLHVANKCPYYRL